MIQCHLDALSARVTPKGVENLKLKINRFALEANQQPNKQNRKTKQKKKIKKTLKGWQEIMDYFVCLANAHA